MDIENQKKEKLSTDIPHLSVHLEEQFLGMANSAPVVKYSKDNDTIIVELSEDTKFVKVSVIGFGIGIHKDHLPKIFDRFYRFLGKKDETYSGLGSGLYFSQQIIKTHKGKVWVENIRNTETKLNVQIPV